MHVRWEEMIEASKHQAVRRAFERIFRIYWLVSGEEGLLKQSDKGVGDENIKSQSMIPSSV